MKIKTLFILLTLVMAFGLSQSAFALTITSQYGDDDGFGYGAVSGHIFHRDKIDTEADDQDNTDEWFAGTQSWEMYIDTSAFTSIKSVFLEIFTGGLSTSSPASLILNEKKIGYVPKFTSSVNIGLLDYYELTNLGALQNGRNIFTIEADDVDAWAMDFSRVIVEGDDTLPVPEPGTFILLGCGLIGLAVYRRKQR